MPTVNSKVRGDPYPQTLHGYMSQSNSDEEEKEDEPISGQAKAAAKRIEPSA